MVFLLGRMGDNKRALNLIIERLGDVQRVSNNLESHRRLFVADNRSSLGYRLCERAKRS